MGNRLRQKISLWLYDIGTHLYRGPVKTVANKTGIDSKYKQFLVDKMDTMQVSVGDTSAKFYVCQEGELFHLNSIPDKEEQTLDWIADRIQPGDVFYDIGGHIGIYSCLIGSLDESINVVSFEPLPANANRIRENAELNNLSVKVVEVALSDDNDEVELYTNSSQVGKGKASLQGNGTETIFIEATKTDDLIASNLIPEPNVIKIDVEGAELDVLSGMETLLKKDHCHSIVVEVHSWEASVREVKNKLREFEYNTNIIDMENRNHVVGVK